MESVAESALSPGMSIEQCLSQGRAEIGNQSFSFAEELTLTTAELPIFPTGVRLMKTSASERGIELGETDRDCVIQAERYGTPLAPPRMCEQGKAATTGCCSPKIKAAHCRPN